MLVKSNQRSNKQSQFRIKLRKQKQCVEVNFLKYLEASENRALEIMMS